MKRLTILLFIILSLQLMANDSPFVRYPSLNNDGSKIAFSYQGDIWVMPAKGGKAERLTIHEAFETRPIWSRDGKQIAFQGERYGNNDIYVISSGGGKPERLTYHSASDVPFDFGSDGNILFTTSREFKQIEWDAEVQKVSAKGGTPSRALNTVGGAPALSPDGRFIAFIKGWGREVREDYRGSANFDIWIYDIKNNKYNKITDFKGHDMLPRWGSNNTLYYISASSGIYNIYKTQITAEGTAAGQSEPMTNYKGEGVRYFSVSADGGQIVFEKEMNIYLTDIKGGSPKKLDVEIAADYRFDPVEWKTYRGDVAGYSVSPNGKYTAMEIRGEIFITENDKEKSKTVNVTKHPYRDQQVQWLSDTTIVFSSDREGQFDLYMIKSGDPKQSNLFKSFKHEVVRLTDTDTEETWPVISPDYKKIAYEIGQGKLVVADIDTEGNFSNELTLLDGWDAPGNVSWSPDSKWLAYSLNDLYYNQEIYIHAADGSKDPVNVTMHPRSDYSPFWSKDGKKLAFISDRNNSDGDIWFVWLNKKDWEKTKQDWEEGDDEDNKDKKKDKKKDDSTGVEPIKIDFDNIYQRLVQVTRLPGNEVSPLISEDGETIYFVARNTTSKGTDLFSIKWDGTDIKMVSKGGANPSRLTFDDKYEYIYMTKRGKLARMKVKGEKTESLPIAAKMKINHPEEYKQIFEEAWRALNVGFYDPDFHGKDWNALHDKYKPWCLAASTTQDFSEIFNYMLGEVNASHMGLYRVDDPAETQNERVGYLGVELIPVDDGVKVVRVVPNTPADKEQSKLNNGDVITAVNDTEIDDEINFYSTLINTANEEVLLSVEDKNGNEREVVIRPSSSISNQLYDEWVESRKELVDKYSKGRIGYLHIIGMSMPSFEQFERELTARGYGKEGIVIDVRFNGGGWTTDYLMTILNYKQHAYTIPRGAADNLKKEKTKFRQYYPLGERLPFAAWTKPSIALCNQNSYSNAEIFSHAYKNLGIGTLVGMPTFGAVISTGGRTLIDGSLIRLPGRGWWVEADDKNMDFAPAVPDEILENAPDSKYKGNDEQLKRAVDVLLKQIDSK